MQHDQTHMHNHPAIQRLYSLITDTTYNDSDYWYFIGKTDVQNIFKELEPHDLETLAAQVPAWDTDHLDILTSCLTYGAPNPVALCRQSYFLTLLLAQLENESSWLDILENASAVVQEGAPHPVAILEKIIHRITAGGYQYTYHVQYRHIQQAHQHSVQHDRITQKINRLRQEITALTRFLQAFDEVDDLHEKAINILQDFSSEDMEQLKTALLTWTDKELEVLAKVFSQGDANGRLPDDNYYYGYLFVLLPPATAAVILNDMFYFFEQPNISKGLLLQMKNKLNELVAKRYIENNTYDYWTKAIADKLAAAQ